MLDPAAITALATTAVAALVPLLQKAVEAGAEELGKTAIGGLLSKLKERLTHEGSKAALSDLAEQPADPAAQGALNMQLRKAISADPEFGAFLKEWLKEPEAQAGSISQVANTYGNSHKVTQIAGSGNSVG